MPSPLGHAIAGVGAGWLVIGAPTHLRERQHLKEVALFAALGMLPDLDLLFGIHSGPTHSIGASAAVGVIAFVVAAVGSLPRRGRLALACVAAYASHVLLDWLGTDASPPLGIMALWPFSRGYLESDLHIFMAISRRYYQGWPFMEQNLRAIARELVVLLPILGAIIWARRSVSRARTGIALVLLVAGLPFGASAAQRPERDEDRGFRDLLDVYRSGDVDRAGERLELLLADPDWSARFEKWLTVARREKRTSDVEALLSLYTERIVDLWPVDDPYPERLIARYAGEFGSLRLALRRMDRQSQFLRTWHLLWESIRQQRVNRPLPREFDYLDEALSAFPKDALLLLAAGSRYELEWTMSLENHHRDLWPEPAAITRQLQMARDFLRRSLEADPNESESRLRLGHVLIQLNDVDGASTVLAAHDWSRDGPAFAYLVRLFEGEVHERRGNRAAAAESYDRAASLVPRPQSALVARAHLGHLEGERARSARVVTYAMSGDSTAVDPWWLFTRGQAWRVEAYLKSLRAMVMQ
jgi:tetratricopeptide (TPR) repeat protein